MTKREPPTKEATVADVARAAGVSKAQAARALGGYGAVSEQVLSLVVAAAEQLGYRPNQLAKSMNTGRSNSIGVVVGDIENAHFGLALRGISDEVRGAGYTVVLVNTDEDLAAEAAAVQELLQQRVAGLIVAPCSSTETSHLEAAQAGGRAVVLFDRGIHDLALDTVRVDFEHAALRVGRLLLDAGHRRIGYVSSQRARAAYAHGMDLGLSPVADRVEGIERAFREAGAEWDPALVKLNATSDDALASACAELLDRPDPATAVVCSDSLIALGVLGQIKRRGLRIPDDISVVAYDDFPWTELIEPPLTVVAQPVYDMGREAARALLRRLGHRVPAEQLPLRANLIERASVGAPSPAADRIPQS
ncbi:LacI family DNA-binding transcriptional regulator [Sinomonas terrae]|uniref:LacI family transcriptional regulator n=1 Tax=Sinomonas terrae TaxID=2908838 RepID=A0ABS9U5L3_9MICC|nr:LacI family DNA-binding transcriptional regulator [Sinomonas terrae]MCH6471968.1 LacI family transcriptional regulator [Sinomonas terrae]